MALFFVTGGLMMFVLAPLYKNVFLPRASLWEFNVLRLWGFLYKIIWRFISDKNYRSMYSTKLGDAPKLHTDRSLVQVSAGWQGADDNCDICKAACCVRLRCPLLGADSRCLSYNSLFYQYFYCGRYPENQSQIDYYNCPKWEMNNETEA
jgi:hypothetical protein